MSSQRKKLIEVALPLPEINDASAFDKRPGIGPHPKGIHHWWARLPMPTARAILFASLVDDPSCHPETWPSEEAQNAERERLFELIRRMMGKKLHEHPEIYADARNELLKHCGGNLPTVFDPFAGGGSIPLEAIRLGLPTVAADLNPVAVLLNKCNLEIAPHISGAPPINPESRGVIGGAQAWGGTSGLAADVRYYGRQILLRARDKVGHLYPRVRLPKERGGGETNVLAWIWARTVASPDPAAHGKHVPLISTYWLTSKKGGEAWLEPIVDKAKLSWRFEVRTGTPNDGAATRAGTKTGRAQFRCILTGTPISDEHIKAEGNAGRLGQALLAIVAETRRGRCYVTPDDVHRRVASSAEPPENAPFDELVYDSRYLTPPSYGMRTVASMFSPRQLVTIVTLCDLIKAIRGEIRNDASRVGKSDSEGDVYARAVMTFLALALDRCADSNNALCRWDQSAAGQRVKNLFGRQAIPMLWDFAEANVLGEKSVCWNSAVDITAEGIEALASGVQQGRALCVDAATGADELRDLLVSTDPPYYDNVPYADISDFFYVWLRRTIGKEYPELFGTMLAPKLPELTASPGRFEGDKEKAKKHFETGFRRAFTALREKMDQRFPLTIYYAFKQDDETSGADDENGQEGRVVDLTTGWETLLDALVASGFEITGTWPVRASQTWRMRAMGSNALASYIVLACRPRPPNAPQTDRRSFVNELKRELPAALRHLQQGNIAPVDFAQAAIGPGMAIFSGHCRVLESRGKSMSVRTALSLINQTLTEVLSEQEDEFDADTRWAIAWFEQNGFGEGDFGQAEILSKAKVTSVAGLQQAGIAESKKGKVRLLRPEELPKDWDPTRDRRLTIWEMTHHLVRLYFHEKAGDQRTADLLRKLGSRGEVARDLAYRLFDVCEKKKRSQEAQAYNALVLGWSEVARLTRDGGAGRPEQTTMFEQE
jgi:putative DNA methylase